MKCTWVCALVALAAGLPGASAAAPEGKAAKRAIAQIRRHYKDPMIGQQECPFPGLLMFTAFERANLNEDPLIPEQWFVYADGPAVNTLPLARIRHQPRDTQEAVALATWLFSTEHRWSLIKATRVEQAEGGGMRVTIEAEMSLVHPMFRQGRKPGTAVVTVDAGRWSMKVDDPFIERADTVREAAEQ